MFLGLPVAGLVKDKKLKIFKEQRECQLSSLHVVLNGSMLVSGQKVIVPTSSWQIAC